MYALDIDQPEAHEMYIALFDQVLGGWLRPWICGQRDARPGNQHLGGTSREVERPLPSRAEHEKRIAVEVAPS